jgi:MinD-like ATPase involved in chromosome partitioning or flagellar assembly
MSEIISIHSYRGGTGKSNTTANVAALMAQRGLRVAVVDTDLNSPGVHMPFGLDIEAADMGFTLNDFLWGNCGIVESAYDVTANLKTAVSSGSVQAVPGQIFLVPASIKTGEITRLLRDGYDVGLLNDGFDDLIDDLNLDVLLVDTHPGLNNETLLSIAISNRLIIILRPDHQDYQGTAVTVHVARHLDVPELLLVLNKVPQAYDFGKLQQQIEALYEAEVAAVIPHSDELMTLASRGIFALHYPHNPVTQQLNKLVERLLKEKGV